jgi:hypothetical protein
VRAPTGLERSGMWLRTSFARSDFSNLVSSPATIEVKAGAAAALGSLARRIGQWPNPGSQIIATIPARRFPLRSDADLHVWVASRSALRPLEAPDANAPRRPLMDSRRVGQLPEQEPAISRDPEGSRLGARDPEEGRTAELTPQGGRVQKSH